MSDQPDQYVGNTNPQDNYYFDPNAKYSDIFRYMGYVPGYGQNQGVPDKYAGIINYRNPSSQGGEGQALQGGGYEVDWSKLPTLGSIAPAFTSKEQFEEWQRNPSMWKNKNATPRWNSNYGWVVPNQAYEDINNNQGGFKGFMHKAGPVMINQVLPSLASITMGSLGMPALAMSAIKGAKALGEGKSPLSVFGNAALGYGLGALGNMMGGRGLPLGNLSKLYGLFNSPGNTRMNMGYRPTTYKAPSSYNFLRGY